MEPYLKLLDQAIFHFHFNELLGQAYHVSLGFNLHIHRSMLASGKEHSSSCSTQKVQFKSRNKHCEA